jgi:xanthine dehydrogenase/oxidase
MVFLVFSLYYYIFRVASCLATAVAAVKVGRPVRLNVERQIDMCVTGHRHPFKISYKVGFKSDGRFSALDIQMWNNAGCSLDLSMSVMEKAMLHMCNCYQFHNIQIRGRVCKTHLPSNTGFYLKNKMSLCKILFDYSLSRFWWSTSDFSM